MTGFQSYQSIISSDSQIAEESTADGQLQTCGIQARPRMHTLMQLLLSISAILVIGLTIVSISSSPRPGFLLRHFKVEVAEQSTPTLPVNPSPSDTFPVTLAVADQYIGESPMCSGSECKRDSDCASNACAPYGLQLQYYSTKSYCCWDGKVTTDGGRPECKSKPDGFLCGGIIGNSECASGYCSGSVASNGNGKCQTKCTPGSTCSNGACDMYGHCPLKLYEDYVPCTGDSVCKKGACAPLNAYKGPSGEYAVPVCCPSGGKKRNKWGTDFCTGMVKGTTCWGDDTCNSGNCKGNMYQLQRGACT